MNDIIRIEQLPVIKESLMSVKSSVIERTTIAMSLAVTEENRKEIKQVRADLNKELKEYDKQLKEVKKAVMQPYEELAAVYKECVSEPYKKADEQLGKGIKEIEDRLKAEKEAEIKKYFEEYAEFSRVDFIPFEKLGLNVTLSASVKSLKEQVAAFLDRVSEEMDSLLAMDNKEELFAEYKANGYNLANAIMTVDNRHKRIESEKARVAAAMEQKKLEEEAVKKVADAVAPRVTAPEVVSNNATTTQKTDTVEYCVAFKVYGKSIEHLKQFKKEFERIVEEGGYTYEDI